MSAEIRAVLLLVALFALASAISYAIWAYYSALILTIFFGISH